MTDYPVRRCLQDGMTIVRLPPVDPRAPGPHDLRLAFKRSRIRKWLRERERQRRRARALSYI